MIYGVTYSRQSCMWCHVAMNFIIIVIDDIHFWWLALHQEQAPRTQLPKHVVIKVMWQYDFLRYNGSKGVSQACPCAYKGHIYQLRPGDVYIRVTGSLGHDDAHWRHYNDNT